MILFGITGGLLGGIIEAITGELDIFDAPLFIVASVIFAGLYFLASIPLTFVVTVRRLHDTGKSGWWSSPFFLILFTKVVRIVDQNIFVALSFIGLFVIFIFALLDSQPTANKWGANPKSDTNSTGTKQCPYCGEEVLAAAKKCKHCGEWLKNK